MTDTSKANEGGFTLVELLVAVFISGALVAVLASAFFVGTKTTIEADARLKESSDAQLLTNYFRADAASAAYFSKTTPPPGCALDSGASPVANFGWTSYATGAPVQHSALYYRPSASSTSLFRRYCEGTTTKHQVEVVKRLSSTTAPVVTCPPLASCDGVLAPSQVVLDVTESSNSYAYKVQGTNRTDPASGSTLLGNISIHVGGDLSMNSQTEILVNNGGVVYAGNVSKCTNKADVVADVMYTAGTGGCGSDGDIDPFPDPLSALQAPDKPTSTGSKTGTCNSKNAWTPGYYSGKLTVKNECLKSGVYYLDGGADLENVTSEAGGVLIYVNNGNVNFDGSNTLAPMTTGSNAGVVLFMKRDLAGTITLQPKSGQTTAIDGIIYAAGGTLELQNNNSTLSLLGAVVVKNLDMGGNADVSVS